jgi:hypothetical protein
MPLAPPTYTTESAWLLGKNQTKSEWPCYWCIENRHRIIHRRAPARETPQKQSRWIKNKARNREKNQTRKNIERLTGPPVRYGDRIKKKSYSSYADRIQ